MKLPTTKLSLNGGRSGDSLGGALATLPSNATVRPGLMETIFASRSEREIMRDRETAAVAVEREQVFAATEVAIARTQNVKEVALKSLTVESARTHHDLETQMQNDRQEADTVQASLVNQIAKDTFTTEKALLDEVKSLENDGSLAPDRAQMLAEIMRRNTENVVGGALDLSSMISGARKARDNRALSRKE